MDNMVVVYEHKKSIPQNPSLFIMQSIFLFYWFTFIEKAFNFS